MVTINVPNSLFPIAPKALSDVRPIVNLLGAK